jgi:hypothetical protein
MYYLTLDNGTIEIWECKGLVDDAYSDHYDHACYRTHLLRKGNGPGTAVTKTNLNWVYKHEIACSVNIKELIELATVEAL